MIKKIVSFFLTFATILSLTCSVFAYDSSMVNASRADIWAMALERYSDSTSGYASMLLSSLGGIVGGGDVVCPISPDNLHHGNVKEFQSPHFSGRSYPVVCICDYCGLDFYSSVSSSQLSDAYDNYVSGLAHPLISDDGALLVQATHYRCSARGWYKYITSTWFSDTGYYYCDHDTSTSATNLKFGFNCGNPTVITPLSDSTPTASLDEYVFYFSSNFQWNVKFPFSGSYEVINDVGPVDKISSNPYGKGTILSVNHANYSLVVVYNFDLFPLTLGSSVSCDAPVFKYLGTDHIVELPDTSTRVAPLTQSINNYNNTDNSSKYFIVPLSYLDSLADLNLGLDPSFCYSPGVYDEETKIFTEPVTGAQYLTTGWIYDYNTRTYDLSLAAGTFLIDGKDIDHIQLTYGDDELTIAYISQGFMVKKDVYAYLIATDTSTCQHIFTSSILQEATCSVPGQRQYTCSKCGYSYTEEIPLAEHTYTTEVMKEATCVDPGERKNTCSVCGNEFVEEIPALGHDWLPTEVTPTTYELPPGISCPDCGGTDITAEFSRGSGTYSVTCNDCGKEWIEQAVITYGQTTYTCSRCGEMYVESEDEHSGLFEAIGDFIADGIIWITDKLQQLIESISGINDIFSEFAGNIKEKAGDYPAFLGSVIAILPEDLMTVFWFGIVSAVVLTVWKKWFR